MKKLISIGAVLVVALGVGWVLTRDGDRPPEKPWEEYPTPPLGLPEPGETP